MQVLQLRGHVLPSPLNQWALFQVRLVGFEVRVAESLLTAWTNLGSVLRLPLRCWLQTFDAVFVPPLTLPYGDPAGNVK